MNPEHFSLGKHIEADKDNDEAIKAAIESVRERNPEIAKALDKLPAETLQAVDRELDKSGTSIGALRGFDAEDEAIAALGALQDPDENKQKGTIQQLLNLIEKDQ